MYKKSSSYAISARPVLLLLFLCCAVLLAEGEEPGVRSSGPLVKRERRRSLFSGEDGEISAARVTDNINGSYLLHFFTLEPNSLFLPALLHADMVFYVHTGSGKLSWTEEGELKSMELTRGDVYRLEEGSFFFIQSNLETQTQRQKLRIYAFFADSSNALLAPPINPYSSVRDMFLGFDREVLQAAFKLPKEVVEELVNSKNPPAIVHAPPTTKKSAFQMEAQLLKSFIGAGRSSYSLFVMNKKKKSGAKLFNLYQGEKDFENCNGWSTTVTRKKLSVLKGSDVGLFMVNLTAGSMMGPHWNPMAMEISVVLEGRGMIRVVCPSYSNATQCRNMRFEVEEGDVFVVPRFHPMAQMSFNNGSLVFVGFSTSAKRNHPQFLAGQASVLRTLDKDVLAMSFGVSNTTLDQFLAPQEESVILGCLSCAEEELRTVREEMEREKEEAERREKEESEKVEEERRKEEEEARKEEEEAMKEDERRKEEEETRKEEEAMKEEEERVKREEEERKSKEEAQKREEEEAKQREEEAQKEEERKREEAQKREEDEERKSREEAQKREEDERQREEAEAMQKEAARREEEAKRKQQEEEATSHKEEEKGGRSEEELAAEEERKWEESIRREEEKYGKHKGTGSENRGWGRVTLKNKRLTV